VAAIAVDLGGTFLRCAVTSDSGLVTDLDKQRIDFEPERRNPDALWSTLFNAIERFARAPHLGLAPHDPIAFAFPGPVADHARIVGAPTLLGRALDMPDVVGILRERTGRPVYLLNDLSAAAWHYLDVLDVDRFMVLTVSSGIGSKFADRAHRDGVLDRRAGAGEIGHIVVDADPGAPICDCGARGHLGAIASGRGTENLANRRSQVELESFDRSLCATSFGAARNRVTNEEHLIPAALAGDPWAWSVIGAAQEPLAQILATTIVAASLEKVVVIGGFAASLGARYVGSLCDAVLARTGSRLIDLPMLEFIVPGESSDVACLRGAGAFAASMDRAAS
jgi:predicted NBD/HSP70 family sugar kinase